MLLIWGYREIRWASSLVYQTSLVYENDMTAPVNIKLSRYDVTEVVI